MAKKKKIRADFRKNRNVRARKTDWTQQFDRHGFKDQSPDNQERVSGKGDLTRRRTVRGTDSQHSGLDGETSCDVQLEVDETVCMPGRVLSVHGLTSAVLGGEGEVYQCATRRILKTLSTDQRSPVAAGDRVLFRPVENSNPKEGLIERVERRHGTISRLIRGRRQVLVANVDQLLIVTSVFEPQLKPNLIDRMLVTAEKGRVRPVICINKIDLVEPALLQPLIGVYSRMGYPVLLISARSGFGLDRLRRFVAGRESVVAGQSGVGKSSILNAIDPELRLRVGSIIEETEKGRHTTTTARVFPISCGGYVVDTPGIRQFELWDVSSEEVGGYYRDLRPYVSLCRFPDCTHTHEDDCAVKDAVADGHLDDRRYESYCHLIAGPEESD